MLHRISRLARRFVVALHRFWRLGTSSVLAYRLQLRDQTKTIGRVIDSRVIGEHLCITDIDGATYLVHVVEVRSYMPLRSVASLRYIGNLQVVGE